MKKKIIHRTPDQLGYKDRGKMKWMGLMLSDHTEALTQMAQQEEKIEVQAKPQQTLTERGAYLIQAYLAKKPVAIQANILQNGSYFNDVHCMVVGFFEETIFLKLKNGRMVEAALAEIRNIEFIDPHLWFEK